MPDGAYNVIAAILAGVVVRWLWVRDKRERERKDMDAAPAPVRTTSPHLLRNAGLVALAAIAYVLLYDVTR